MKNLFITLTLLILTLNAYSQNQGDLFREDLEFLRVTLPSNHINLFAKISKNEFEERIEQIKSKVDILNEDTFHRELRELMVAIGDEHTRVEPVGFFSYTLPMGFTIFNEGIFVTEAVQSDLLLARLVKINGVAIEEVIQQFKKIIPSHNNSFFYTMLQFDINNTHSIKSLGLTDTKKEVLYTFEKRDNSLIEIKIELDPKAKTHKADQFSKILAHSDKKDYWYKYDEDKNLIYFNYMNCKDSKDNPFEQFNNELFELIETKQPTALILDLRYNGGGNSAVISPFLTKLKNSYLNKKGNLYILIGKMTFSSALLNAIDLKRNFKSILIGEPTAGSINHYGEIKGFTLPNTKTAVIYSTKYFEQWKGHNGSLNPDVTTSYSVENFNECKDEALEYIYSRISKK